MTVPDELEEALRDMEARFGVDEPLTCAVILGAEDHYEVDPETLAVTSLAQPAIPEAAVVDAAEQGASGVEVVTEADIDAFERRLRDATEALAADGGPELDVEAVAGYIVGRATAELPAGEAGVAEHFGGDVEAADLERVYELTRGAA